MGVQPSFEGLRSKKTINLFLWTQDHWKRRIVFLFSYCSYFSVSSCEALRAAFALVLNTSPFIGDLGHYEMMAYIGMTIFALIGVYYLILGQPTKGEVREDGHPVVILSAKNVAEILRDAGFSDKSSVGAGLKASKKYT